MIVTTFQENAAEKIWKNVCCYFDACIHIKKTLWRILVAETL
jgi:hypothetical protein